eukprot:363384-Chlamydomonas_euryale.AAC.9
MQHIGTRPALPRARTRVPIVSDLFEAAHGAHGARNRVHGAHGAHGAHHEAHESHGGHIAPPQLASPPDAALHRTLSALERPADQHALHAASRCVCDSVDCWAPAAIHLDLREECGYAAMCTGMLRASLRKLQVRLCGMVSGERGGWAQRAACVRSEAGWLHGAAELNSICRSRQDCSCRQRVCWFVRKAALPMCGQAVQRDAQRLLP